MARADDKDDNDNDDDEIYESKSNRSSSYLDKDDLILMLLMLIVGGLIGFFIHRLLHDKDKDFHHLYQSGMYHHPVQHTYPGDTLPAKVISDTQPKIHPPRGTNLRSHHKNYHMDKADGEVVLDPPLQYENWVIKRDMYGRPIDAYKIEGSEWVR